MIAFLSVTRAPPSGLDTVTNCLVTSKRKVKVTALCKRERERRRVTRVLNRKTRSRIQARGKETESMCVFERERYVERGLSMLNSNKSQRNTVDQVSREG